MEINRNIDDETVRLGLGAILPGHNLDVWRVLGTGVSAVLVAIIAESATAALADA